MHDLKVPISVIDAGAKSLLNRPEVYGGLTEKQSKVIKRIIRNTLSSRRLVNDILELGRSREGVTTCVEFSLAFLISSVLVEIFDLLDPSMAEAVRKIQTLDELNQVMQEKGTRIKVDEMTWDTVVYLDLAKVKQILRNLLTNAYKHRSSFVEIFCRLNESQLILEVKDDGRGIPKADHDNIFKTYFTKGGSVDSTIQNHGLGLAGVMVLLRDMGGELSLDSKEGSGARFTAVIPL